MLSRLRVHTSGQQRLVWSELLQWGNLILVFFVVIQIAMAIGIWIVSSHVKPFLQGHNADVLPSLILTCSTLTIFMAVLGYNGLLHSGSPQADERFNALKRLMWFELIGTLVGLANLIFGITGFSVVHGNILWAAERGIKSDMNHYPSTPAAKEKLDRLQTAYMCCGATSYRDWFEIPWQKYSNKKSGELEDSVPWSCCSPDAPRPCVHFSLTQNILHKAYTYPGDLTLHSQGCVAAITQYLGHHMYYICGSLMLFIGFILIVIVLWTRLLETSIANAYRIGDPDISTWGYFVVNYGPEIQELYDEVEQSSERSYDSYRESDDDESTFVPDSDLGEYDSDERVIAVSSPIDLPSTHTIYQIPGEGQSMASKSTATGSGSGNDNNNRSPNNNDTLLRRLQETARQQEKAVKKRKRKAYKRIDTKAWPAPISPPPPLLPPPPPPPPPPADTQHQNNMPALPPLPFQ